MSLFGNMGCGLAGFRSLVYSFEFFDFTMLSFPPPFDTQIFYLGATVWSL